ncbi:hypothetical protein NNJEOMEG_00992 [Fundidesulfovibrio magnetotacticus]|uniref:Uncharacterized protein n=1 Tax=Fundidesulfovibrio magnetotacticus TaxID=2730080 RepID=A0A6V8LRI0_9BACT|nr:hypothetical protein [Fundidesulfovibrio magnetotacticus]GFK93161.1 hypothetical protein NNJEOMEG_00992 [Fundidesulfovibrio magnetotacticus]
MSLLSKLASQTKSVGLQHPTDKFVFGSPEAEAEATLESTVRLLDVFEDFLGVLPLLNTERFIIIGRKGSGKSAIAEYICAKADDDAESFASFVRHDLIGLYRSVLETKDKPAFSLYHLFEWVILITLLEFIFNNEALADDKEYGELKKFYEKNSGFIDKLGAEIVKTSKSSTFDIGVEYLKRFMTAKYKTRMDVQEARAPFYKILPSLKKAVLDILSSDISRRHENSYYVFFDDLDINFTINSDIDRTSLADLLRVVKDYNNNFFSKNNLQGKIVVLLRDDIIYSLNTSEADMSKIIHSYGIHLHWYDRETFYKNIGALPIKRFIDKRLSNAFSKLNIHWDDDAWLSFAGDSPTDYGLLKDIIDITFCRPRDMILLFDGVKNLKTSFPLQLQHLKKLIGWYCTKLMTETKNELVAFYSREQIEALMNTLKELSRGHEKGIFTLSDFELTARRCGYSGDTKRALELLFGYSMIGNIDKKTDNNTPNVYYKYREPSDAPYGIKLDMAFCIHKSLQRYFSRE